MLFDNITAKKQAHLRILACTYIRKNRRTLTKQFSSWPPPFRVDVIGVIFEADSAAQPAAPAALEHLKGAV